MVKHVCGMFPLFILARPDSLLAGKRRKKKILANSNIVRNDSTDDLVEGVDDLPTPDDLETPDDMEGELEWEGRCIPNLFASLFEFDEIGRKEGNVEVLSEPC